VGSDMGDVDMWPNTIFVRLAVCGVVPIVLTLVQNVAVQAETGRVPQLNESVVPAITPSPGRTTRLVSAAILSDEHGEHEKADQLIAFHGHRGYRSYGYRRYGAYRYGYRGYGYRGYGYGRRSYYYGYSRPAYGYRYGLYGSPFSYGYARPYQYRTYPYAYGSYYRPWFSYYYRPWYYRPYSYPYGYSYGIPWYRHPASYGYRESVYVPTPSLSGYGGPVRYYGTYGYGCAPDCVE